MAALPTAQTSREISKWCGSLPKALVPQWGLDLVLRSLRNLLCEPIEDMDVKWISLKIAFFFFAGYYNELHKFSASTLGQHVTFRLNPELLY